MSADQRRVYREIAEGPRGGVPGPLAIWLHAPQLAETAQRLGSYCRFGTSLGSRLSEMVILIVARHHRARFEWWAHERLALQAGLDPAVIGAIKAGRRPSFTDPASEALYAFCKPLLEDNRVPDAVYARAVEAFSEAAIVETVGILGYYALVSYTLNAFAVPIPDGAPDPFPDT